MRDLVSSYWNCLELFPEFLVQTIINLWLNPRNKAKPLVFSPFYLFIYLFLVGTPSKFYTTSYRSLNGECVCKL
jgi:hypothetical protein